MPRGDGSGPAGMGSMTGRAAGFCAGYGVPGYMNPYGGYPYNAAGRGAYPAYGALRPRLAGFGRGRVSGFGFGRGGGRW